MMSLPFHSGKISPKVKVKIFIVLTLDNEGNKTIDSVWANQRSAIIRVSELPGSMFEKHFARRMETKGD